MKSSDGNQIVRVGDTVSVEGHGDRKVLGITLLPGAGDCDHSEFEQQVQHINYLLLEQNMAMLDLSGSTWCWGHQVQRLVS